MVLALVPTEGTFKSLLHRTEGTEKESEVDLCLLLVRPVDLTRLLDKSFCEGTKEPGGRERMEVGSRRPILKSFSPALYNLSGAAVPDKLTNRRKTNGTGIAGPEVS